jgi:LPS-assembly protein
VKENEEVVAKGDARISLDNFTLQADEIKFQKELLLATANGNVKIDNGKVYAVSDCVSCDMSTDLVQAGYSRAKIHNYYFSATQVNLKREEQSGKEAQIFHSNPEAAFVPSIGVKNFTISNDDILKAENVKFRIGRIPVFYLPSAEIELSDRPIYTEQDFGVDHSHGAYLQNNVYFAVRKGIKFGLLLDYYTKRGILFGPALKVENNSEKNQLFLEAKIGAIRDMGKDEIRGVDVKNDPIQKRRGFAELAYKQHYDDKIDIIATAQWLSDSEVERNFRKSWYDKHQRPNCFAEVAYRGENHIVSAFYSDDFNRFYDTTKRLPEVSLDYLPTKILETKLIHTARLGFIRLQGRDKITLSKADSSRSDVYYGISLPIQWDDFITLKPLFTARGLSYYNEAGDGTYSKGLVQGGFDVDFKFVGWSDYENETFGINGLKHTINPVIQYRIIPSGNISERIPHLEMEFENMEMPSIDLDSMRNVDHLQKQNMIRVGLRNNLSTQSGEYAPRKLAKFDVFQDILFERNRDNFFGDRRKRIQDTHLIAGVYPVQWLKFDACGRIDPQKLQLHKFNTITSINDGDFWEAAFCTNYWNLNGSKTEQYGLKISFNLSSETTIFIEEKYDARIRKIFEQKFSMSTIVYDSWIVNLGVTLRERSQHEDRFQFDWSVKLLDF